MTNEAKKAIAWMVNKSNCKTLYISHVAGDAGEDWGYDEDIKKATYLSEMYQKRFCSDQRYLENTHGITFV